MLKYKNIEIYVNYYILPRFTLKNEPIAILIHYSHYHKTKTLISLGIWTKIEVLPDADDQTSHKVYGYLPKGGSPFKIKDKKEK